MARKELTILVAEQKILNRIYVVRGQKVMLDEDLAGMYAVETRRLNEQVKRNTKRFQKISCLRLPKRVRKLEVAKCDIKLGWQKKVAQCFYRTGNRHVVKYIKQRCCNRS